MQAVVWLRRIMTKPSGVLYLIQAPGSSISLRKHRHHPYQRAALCSPFHGHVADVCRRLGAEEHPRDARCKDRVVKDAEAITAHVYLAQAPRRHHQRPSAAVWCSQLLTCFPLLPLPTLRTDAAKSDNLVPKPADALNPKRTGPCKCYPRRYHVSRPSLPLSVT